MSKNFELLQQVGDDKELFRRAVHVVDARARVDSGPNPNVDKETVERILQKASLPDVFQSPSEPERQTQGGCSEFCHDLNEQSASRNLQDDASVKSFRTSRNPGSPIGAVVLQPIGDACKDSEDRVAQSAAREVPLPEPIHGEEPLPAAKKKIQQKSSQKTPVPLSWLDSIKTGAKEWRWKVQARNNHYGTGFEKLIREEEIKLAQRVFPGTNQQGSPRAVLFASFDGEAGCGRTCARVAEILAARAEGPVCVVDANFSAPSLHEYFGADNTKGLAESTVESGPIQNFVQQIPEPDLWLMPSGKAAAGLRFPAMADGLRVRIEELRDTFTYIVINSGPLRLESSTMLLSRWTDGVVLTVEANATRRDAARRLKETLSTANVRVLGVVLNNREFPIPEAIYRRL
jgi:Mrp family chromosome partitioning ATPase